MTASRRFRYSLGGVSVSVSVYRKCPMPGIDFELDTPRGTIGGYIHA